MNSTPALDSLLQSLGRLLDLPDLAWDDQQSCTLSFGEDVHLTLYADEERPDLTMYSLIGQLSSQAPAPVWRELMQANLFGQGTGGATLGYEPDSQWVYLSRRLPADGLSAQQWLGEVQAFVDACRVWSARLPTLAASVTDSDEASPSAGTATASPTASAADFRTGLGVGMLRA